jgi:phosphate transport system ATP-binding protein
MPVRVTRNFCPKCGRSRKKGAQFCGGCGAEYAEVNSGSATAPQTAAGTASAAAPSAPPATAPSALPVLPVPAASRNAPAAVPSGGTTTLQPAGEKDPHVSRLAMEAYAAQDMLDSSDQGKTGSLSVLLSEPPTAVWDEPRQLAALEARDITAWFGDHMVLDQVSLTMQAGKVTALIGPSGCGKSTFLRILNRMHQLVPSASLAGEVLLDGVDIYNPSVRLTQARRDIGMVFQKPNPFPAMSIYDNVVAGLKLTGVRVSRGQRDAVVEECLTKAGLWTEVRNRLRQPGGALSGGQQQRLCIARSLAVRPRVLLMDEPCSALDPTSTRVIEETMSDLVREVTIVIVTHNMQQAQRVSRQCAFFLAAQGEPGHIVEHGPTDAMFGSPRDPRTADYVQGRFG